MTAREPIEEKAARYLTSGALTVIVVDGDRITATCRGDSGLHCLGHHPRVVGGWWCGCPSRATCAHLVALKLVTSPRCALLEDAVAERTIAA